MDINANLIFIISAFALGIVVYMTRDSLAPKMRRGLALVSIFFILFAFFLIAYSFFTMGLD
ncbi:MAG: hypothetical protein ACE3L7_26020 [Candidatus Pristimantibacillus sp.]